VTVSKIPWMEYLRYNHVSFQKTNYKLEDNSEKGVLEYNYYLLACMLS
jgi:hypothetical protein